MSQEEMENVLMEIMKDRVDERVSQAVSTAVDAERQETLVSSIRNLMSNLGLSVAQAMDALSIPQSRHRENRLGALNKQLLPSTSYFLPPTFLS